LKNSTPYANDLKSKPDTLYDGHDGIYISNDNVI